MVAVKVCGITEHTALKAAVQSGAGYIGLNFYPPSPRYVETAEAQALSALTPEDVGVVGVFVNPSREQVLEMSRLVYLDYIQLHGDESPKDTAEIKETTGLPVIKAFRISKRKDLRVIEKYSDAADWFLFDTKPRESSSYGGTGKSFDWPLLLDISIEKPWILAGGINAGNVLDALDILSPDVIDLSSGIESAPGVKSPAKTGEFFDVLKKSGSLRPPYLKRL